LLAASRLAGPVATCVYFDARVSLLLLSASQMPTKAPHAPSYFFDSQIRKIYQLQVQIIQAIQASIIYMGNGNFPNCLPPARVGHYCMHCWGCWGFKTGLKWGEPFLAPKSTYYMQDHVFSAYRRCESHFNRVSERKYFEFSVVRLCSFATN
jgi:hypothetical protein